MAWRGFEWLYLFHVEQVREKISPVVMFCASFVPRGTSGPWFCVVVLLYFSISEF